MMRKTEKIARVACMLLALFFIATVLGCGGGEDAATTNDQVDEVEETQPVVEEEEEEPLEGMEKVFTTEELAEFDGRDGKPAYVAVEGVVYDVTGSQHWQSGTHTDCSFMPQAGGDLTEDLERSPANMEALIKAMPVVGRMAGQ
jgi:predicted heme/steroid binding protein